MANIKTCTDLKKTLCQWKSNGDVDVMKIIKMLHEWLEFRKTLSLSYPLWVEALKRGGAWERTEGWWLFPKGRKGLLFPDDGKSYTNRNKWSGNNTLLNSFSLPIGHNVLSKNPGDSNINETEDSCLALKQDAYCLRVGMGRTELGIMWL